MKISSKPQLASFLIGFVFFFVFIRASQGQGQVSINIKPDTLCILNGHVDILLKQGTYETLKTDQLVKMYSSAFNAGQVISTSGYQLSKNSSLRFYLTSIENHELNDGGLSTWKLIESFTDRIPQSRWMESKWEAHAGGYWYFVNLASNENPKKFYKFIFFYIDGKLAFCVHEYTVDPEQTAVEKTDIKNFISYVYADTHPSRYTSSFAKKMN